MSNALEGKQIVLGVCGGIAAYKSVELLRLLVKQGASVKVMTTANATHFVGAATFEALSGQKVCSDLFGSHEDASIQHIRWAESADAVVVAPATANMIGKLAHGIADDALSTFLLAVSCPVMICPSMNTQMCASHAVQRNIGLLRNFGYKVIDPDAGELACGTTGPGRLPDPAVLVELLTSLLTPKDFRSQNVVVTAGPTREAIDPVRFLSNPSSGKMGYAIARAAEMRGCQRHSDQRADQLEAAPQCARDSGDHRRPDDLGGAGLCGSCRYPGQVRGRCRLPSGNRCRPKNQEKRQPLDHRTGAHRGIF